MDDFNDASQGYFMLHDLLVTKLVPHVDNIFDKAVIQIVVPLKFRDLVLKTSKPNQSIAPAPLYPIPAIGLPMEYLVIDCMAPLPPSKSGSQYLLTVMCQATCYPAAYPLRLITAKSIVKALTQFISVFGITKVVQSDQGSNFSSNLFAQISII